MKQLTRLLLALSALFTFAATQASAQSEIVNAVNLVRGTIQPKELTSCRLRSNICPIVANNCPATHPVCRVTTVKGRYKYSRPYKACKCTNTTAVSAFFVEPCQSGVNCSAIPVPTPTPTSTTSTTSSTTSTTTSTTSTSTTTTLAPYATLYMEAELVGSGVKARNGQTLVARPGQTIQYRWGSPGAASSYAVYNRVSGTDTCGWARSGYWPKGAEVYSNNGAAGRTTGVVQQCQVGATYEIVFRPSSATGFPLPEARVYIAIHQ